jgi:hypothetical protein
MRKFLQWYSGLSIYLKLIPFLILYLLISFLFRPAELVNDEIRYMLYTKYLLNGIYSPAAPDINLWAGRGYPALLVPLLLLKVPVIGLRLLNAFLLYFSLIVFNKTIEIYTSSKAVSIYTILLALYFPMYKSLPALMTECLTWFLLTLIVYLFVKISKQKTFSWKSICLCGFIVAYLAMTKIIFGWVIIVMVVFSFALLLVSRYRSIAKASAYIFSLAFILCIPYLLYTYTLTNKVFYWTNCSGMSLYTMSAPYPKDYGDWKPAEEMALNPNYRDFIQSISKLQPLDQDIAYKKQAIENIKKYPAKYFMNCIANTGRLFFEYPFTNVSQSTGTFFFMIPNMFVVVFITIALGLGIYYRQKLPGEILFMLVFVFIYLSGSVLVSAYCRMFIVTMPFWMLFFFYVFNELAFAGIKKSINKDDLK